MICLLVYTPEFITLLSTEIIHAIDTEPNIMISLNNFSAYLPKEVKHSEFVRYFFLNVTKFRSRDCKTGILDPIIPR